MNSFELFQNWIRTLDVDSNVGFLTDTDPDGLCAATIARKAIERITGGTFSNYYFQRERAVTQGLVDFVKEKKLTHLVCTDWSLSKGEENLFNELLEKTNVLVIDHHETVDPNKERILVINSKDFEFWKLGAVKYPAAKIVYDFFSKVVNVIDLDWLACIGIFGDVSSDVWGDFVSSCCRKYDITPDEINLTSIYLNASRFFGQLKSYETISFLYSFNGVREILNSNLKNAYLESERIFKEKREDLINNAERHNKLVYYELNSEFNMGSPLSTVVSMNELAGRVVVVVQEVDGKLRVSMRCQDASVQVNQILERVIMGLKNAFAGGHPVAAGATIEVCDRKLFKKNLFNTFDELT